MEIIVDNKEQLDALGVRLGSLLKGGEAIELIGDVGAGKTTLVKAIANGMGVSDTVGSPSYTLSQTYDAADGKQLVHYDFYRLSDPGILMQELHEVLTQSHAVVAIEWADIVADVLPADHMQVHIIPTSDDGRRIVCKAGGDVSRRLLEQLV